MSDKTMPHLSDREKEIFWNGLMIGILIGILIFTFIYCCLGTLNK